MIKPITGAIKRMLKKDDGKPTENVVANANRSSLLSRLCKCVVPVRGWPRMNTGSSFSCWLFIALPYIRVSHKAPTVFSIEMHVRKSNRGQYTKTSMSMP